MIIKELSEVPFVELSGYENVKKQIVLGPKDGSEEIVIRYFQLAPGGSSPRHKHGFPHLVQVEKGTGVVVDAEGQEHPLTKGNYVYVNDNELHSFRNTGSDSFEFVCTVPARGES
jgi:quercetin dioxygenase-like cupin family protein